MIAFLLAHWELTLGFILVLAYWIITELLLLRRGQSLDANQLVQLMNREKIVIIDIRVAENFAKGHILHAVSMPKNQFLHQITSLNKVSGDETNSTEKQKSKTIALPNPIKKLMDENVNKSIILVDDQGMDAHKLLPKLNFEKKYYLKNGMQGWLQASLPLHQD